MTSDGWKSYAQVRMLIEESIKPIYLSHFRALAKTMVVKSYTPLSLSLIRETSVSSMFTDNAVLH